MDYSMQVEENQFPLRILCSSEIRSRSDGGITSQGGMADGSSSFGQNNGKFQNTEN